MKPAELLVQGLAAWRLASLLVNEDGPGDVFSRLRYRAGVRQVVVNGPHGPAATRTALTGLAKGLTCVWCVSVWTAGLLGLLTRRPAGRALRDALAVSAGAIAVHEGLARLRVDQR